MKKSAQIKQINGKKVLYVDDKPFYMISGEIHNSSSSSIEYLSPILDKLESMNLNSVLLPITWQMIEPKENEFDFSLTDAIIKEVEKHNLKLGILWFGTWKNAQCSYCPEWIKVDTKNHFRAELVKGETFIKRKSGLVKLPYSTISPFSKKTMEADAKAFAKLMKHIKMVDKNRTVITIQVENETGFLGGDMDYCDASLLEYEKDVPIELIKYLNDHIDSLDEKVKKQVLKNRSGNWENVFEDLAHEIFIAYHTAKYVEYVASAGKKEYNLPMSVNCWLNTKNAKPGEYPCGGPIAKMMEVWMYAAPSIDIFAPDNYLHEFCDVLNEFNKNNNPIYVPESKPRSFMMARQVYLIGQLNGMCYASFGVEDIGNDSGFDLSRFAPLIGFATDTSKSYPVDIDEYSKLNKLLVEAMSVIINKYGTSDIVVYTKELNKMVNKTIFDEYEIKTTFIPKKQKDNFVLIERLSKDEFLFLGYHTSLSFASLDKDRPYMQNLSIEEGEYVDGIWKTIRVLNGDEEMMLMMNKPSMLKIKVNCFK